MLFAMTVPEGLATTDFGEMSPVIRSWWTSRVVFEGSPGGSVGADAAGAAGAAPSGRSIAAPSPVTAPPASTSDMIAMATANWCADRPCRSGFLRCFACTAPP